MTTLGFQAIGGLEIIESGLNDLRRSQLMIIPEFKYMFGAIQKHHSDLKFAHITGKAKDLLDQAVRDTKFYNILIKMLCEVKQRRTGEQRAGLRQVYTWYQANKHVLYCGPRFGKDFMREQAKEILHKSMSTKSKKRTVSARERLAGNRNFSEHLSLENADTNTVKENLDPQNSTMGPKDVNIVSVQDIFNNDAHPSDVNKNMEETQVTFKDDSSYTSSEPKVARPKSAISVTISHLNEKSGNPLAQKVTTMIHPLSALVNPHAHIASALEDKSMNKTKSVISHISSVSKPDNLQSWQAFMKNRSYGQDIVGKLNFVGRSGTALDVRYSAHSYGESPEAYTKELMDQHVKQLNASENMLSSDEDEENYLVRQTLEEFYQTADIMRPTTRNSSRMSSHSRVRSARGERIDTKPAQEVAPIAKQPLKLGHQLDLLPSNINSSPVPPKDIGIKLNTVVNNIDSVSEEMTYFKEKLVPHPQHGFRQPSVAGLPTPRDEITNTHNFVQSSSDLSSIKSRPVTASYTTDKELTTQQLQKSKLRCKSASGIDWRGRIEPDSVRYKWSKTKFGSHTYLKKWIGVHTQPSGKSSSKARPKTAPSSVKEKLKTQKEQNVRAVQAASHDTTVVDQKDMENMMTIQHLLPGDDGVDPRLLYDYDQKFWKNVRKSSVSSATELPKEFLSFVSSSTMLDKKKSSHSILGDQKTQQVYKDARSEIHTSFVNDEEHCKENTIETEENVELQKTLNEHFSSEIYPEKQKAEITFAEFSETLNPKATYQQEESEDLVHLPAKLQLSTDKNNNNLDKSTDLLPHHFSDVQLNQDILCSDCQSQDKMKTARVERSAGRMPPRSLSAHLTGYNRVTEVLRKAPPLRTPPSIPSPQLYFQTPERKSGQIFVELEHHARRTKSPKSFMQKVEGLRSVSSIHQSPIPNKTSNESIIGTSLQVCRLPVARKTPTAQLLSDFNLDFTDRNVTDQTYLSSSAQYLKHKHVSFSDLQQTHPKSTSAPTSSPRSSLEEAELRNAFSRQSRVEDSSSRANKSLARIGRPIAQVMQVTDPVSLSPVI
ncbi:structure-specific endonuclease subunit slx4 [Biomphalaria glabrata]